MTLMPTLSLPKKYFIGLSLRTTNQEGRSQTEIPRHWMRFFEERVQDKIPNKANDNIVALYTEYEGDFLQPYSLIVGCEVTSLDDIPEGLAGKEVPSAEYRLFPVKGPFPYSLLSAWKAVWTSNLKRAYTNDFEIYPAGFNPLNPSSNPEVSILISAGD